MAKIPIKINHNDNINIKINHKPETIRFGFDEELAAITNYDYYEGPYVVTPLAYNKIILETNDKLMQDDVTVNEVPYFETSNVSGMTAYIANIV